MQLQTGQPVDDDTALAELYQRYAQILLCFIRRYVSTREDAEDVLLEAFLAAMERHSLRGLSSGEQLAWLRRPSNCSISNLTATQDTLYAQVNNNQSTSLLALNPTKRSVLWSKNLAASYGQPLIINQELIYVVASDSRIEALNASNGTTVKSYTDATATITGFTLVA